jgi:hypothetical protein
MSKFKRIRRLPGLIAVFSLVALAVAAVAIADNLIADGDSLVPVNDNDMAFGAVPCGQATPKDALLAISRQGSATGTNTFQNGATVTVSLQSVTGLPSSGVTVGSGNPIVLPSDWQASTTPNGTRSTAVTSTVTVNPTTSGPGNASITYAATGKNADGNTITRTDTMAVSWTAGSCDATPPVITPNVTGTLGDNGWYTSNVGVSFSVSDPESAITSQSAGCAGGSVISDTTGVTFTCAATSAGGSDTKSVTIKRDATKPVITRDATADSCAVPGTNGWCRGTQTAGFSASDLTSGLVGQSSPYKFTKSTGTNGSAVQISSGTIKDNAGNGADAIDAGPFKIDSVAPSIDGSASPAANSDGWNNTDVTVSFTCSDTGGSGVSDTCGPNATLTNEGRDQSVTGNVLDDAGNSASKTVSGIKIDKTGPSAPTASFGPAPSAYTDPSGTKWFKDAVSVSYSGSTDPDLNDPRSVPDKSGSGVKSYSANDSLSSSGTLNYSGTATDRADNVSDATTGTVKVDAADPLLQVTGCPAGSVAVGSSQSLTVTASDGQSGLKSNPSGTVSLDTDTIGQKSKTVEAEDNVGHKVSQTCTYDVDFDFSGFYQPVDMNGVFNKAKAGSAIPVKFSLDGAPRPGSNTDGLAGALSAFDTTLNPNPVAVLVACPTSTALIDVIEEVAADSNSGLKYDPAADQWVYVWKTTTVLANSCRQLRVKLADGTTKTANFQFTK